IVYLGKLQAMAWTPRVARVFAHGGRRWPLLVRSEGIFPLSRISVTRPLSSEVAPGGSPSAAAEETKARSVDVHKARPVTPLRFDEEKLIFVSDVDVKEVVMAARRKCQLGALLSLGGFYSFLASLSLHGAISMEIALVATFGLIVNAYVKLATSQKLIIKLADRHVEQIQVKTPPADEEDAPKDLDAAQKLLLEGASMEERLQVTKELHIKLRTARNDHRFLLVDEFKDESIAYKLDDAMPEAAEKASMGALCKLGLIDIDEVAGKCHDAGLVSALKTCRKV
ncbi:Hypothetical protein SCF082_LOCUS45993, partial [Durusdinium trenchii]